MSGPIARLVEVQASGTRHFVGIGQARRGLPFADSRPSPDICSALVGVFACP